MKISFNTLIGPPSCQILFFVFLVAFFDPNVVLSEPSSPTSSSYNSNGAYTIFYTLGEETDECEDLYLEEKSVGSSGWSYIEDAEDGLVQFTNKPEGSYRYRMTAMCIWVEEEEEEWEEHSDEITVVVLPGLAAPSDVSAPAIDEDGRFEVSWSGIPGATHYGLERRLGNGTWEPREGYSEPGRIESGITYGDWSYRARACDATSCGSWSATVTVSVLAVNPPPSPPEVINGLGSISYLQGPTELSWYPPAGAASYILEERLDETGWNDPNIGLWKTVHSGPQNFYNAGGKGVSASNGQVRQSYRVSACNEYSECSEWSPVKTVTTYWHTTQATLPPWDEEIEATWNAFTSALDTGDVASAMEYVLPSKHSKYEPALIALGSDVQALSARWSDFREVKIYDFFAEFVVTETVNGVERLHVLMFQLDGNEWKLAEF